VAPNGGNDGADHRILPHQTQVGSGRPGIVNLPTAGLLGARAQREAGIALLAPARLAQTILLVAVVVTAISAVLEFANPGNYWVLFEDISTAVAPGAGALAVAIAASRSEPEHRVFRWVLALALGLTALGQLVADIPDAFPGTAVPLLRVVSEGCNVIGAMAGILVLWSTVYRRLDGEARRQAFLDGLIIMAASITFIAANWLRTAVPGAQVAAVFANPMLNLFVPLASAIFVSTASSRPRRYPRSCPFGIRAGSAGRSEWRRG